MKKNYAFIFLLFFATIQASATHIVGGEFQLRHKGLRGPEYTLTLNLYFDEINGSRDAEDPIVRAAVFSKRTNQLITNFVLPKVSQQQVSYSNPTCTNSRLRTRQITYSADISLNASTFNDAEGYYVIWERCCRNVVISNINNPGAAGNTFYMEFPAVTSDGNAFINSSPVFEIPKGDYACINIPFVFNFGATDPDGDRLVYSLVTPFAGTTNGVNSHPAALNPPEFSPGPYKPVQWTNGTSLSNIIPGRAPLRVDPATGQLSFTASRLGLYVFSVLCEEYRNGRKIGEVRRDFQIMVIDCPVNIGPQVRMRVPGSQNFYQPGQLVTISDPNQRCLDMLITDANNRDNVTLSIRPLNFGANLATISPTAGVINGPGDTLRARLCISDCIATPGPYWVEIISTDAGCPLPKTDTLRVQVNLALYPNAQPQIVTSLINNAGMVMDGQTLNFNITGTDADRDQIAIEAAGRGFKLEDLGMAFTSATGTGAVSAPFSWQPACGTVKPGAVYQVDFTVIDKRCPGNEKRSIVTVRLEYRERPNSQPEVTTDLAGNGATIKPGQELRFNVLGLDKDNDGITIKAAGRGFDMAAAGMQFRSGSSGTGRLTEPFVWIPDCAVLEQLGDRFIIDFSIEDNRCSPNRLNTVSVEIDLSDYELASGHFEPPNVFTPNTDDVNRTFYIPQLPPDNCRDQFEKIEIYNRWGRVVYQSSRRDFAWTGDGYPSGMYYYQIKYRNSTYKGTLSLLR
jgi:gliding motility-associated-like protein